MDEHIRQVADEFLFRRYARASGQVFCGGGHEEWWLGAHRCPWCKAAL